MLQVFVPWALTFVREENVRTDIRSIVISHIVNIGLKIRVRDLKFFVHSQIEK